METLKSFSGSSFRWSLPCDVNSSVIAPSNLPFIKEARKSQAVMKDKEYTAIDIEGSESQRLLDHDTLAQNYQESQEITIVPRYTSKATLQISATPVDEAIPLDLDPVAVADKKSFDLESLQTKVLHSKYSVYIPTYRSTEDRKVDENGNALHQNPNTKTKKKKIQTDKNVVVLKAESVEGHRSDIINDVDKLIQYIRGDKQDHSSNKAKSNIHKSKQLHKQHVSEDSSRGSGTSGKKQRAHSSKGKEPRPEMKKSNSLGEISTAKLDDFAFVNTEEDNENKVVLRGNKSQSDRPKERRSWGNVEPPTFQLLSSNASTENLETAENWVVTKTKKKSKKRRNSTSSSSRRQMSSCDSNTKQHSNRALSPDFRGKLISSVPHSEKSDSSDADSVHSLPLDGMNVPISYADIAKNTEKAKEKKASPEKPPEKVPNKDRSPKTETEPTSKKEKVVTSNATNNNIKITHVPVLNHVIKSPPDIHHASKTFPVIPADPPKNVQPPDFSDTRSFPAIPTEMNNLKSPPINCDTPHVPPNFPPSQTESAKPFPPDVNDTKSFPAMPTDGANKGLFSLGMDGSNNVKVFPATVNNNNNNNKVLVEKTNVKNTSMSGGRVRNVSPGSKVMTNRNSFNNNNNNNNVNVKSGAPQNSAIHNDIQNDLSILHSNEKESIQYNAQMLPPNIPDVSTIEKMHFLNCHPQHQHQQHAPPSPMNNYPPLIVNQTSESTQTPTTDTVTSPSSNKNKSDCDISDRTMAGDSNSNSRGVGVDVVVVDEEETGPPPVVILSGIGNKEVTGLVFGFDVNEQLLQDDICDNFIARFVAPEGYTHMSHNHDKIVNFIGSTWEAIINQSNGKVKYYMEES